MGQIYLFKRADGKFYSSTMESLTDLGFKLQRTAKGNLEAVPADILCLCAGCDGTGARELEDDPGSYVMCLSCDGKGLY